MCDINANIKLALHMRKNEKSSQGLFAELAKKSVGKLYPTWISDMGIDKYNMGISQITVSNI